MIAEILIAAAGFVLFFLAVGSIGLVAEKRAREAALRPAVIVQLGHPQRVPVERTPQTWHAPIALRGGEHGMRLAVVDEVLRPMRRREGARA